MIKNIYKTLITAIVIVGMTSCQNTTKPSTSQEIAKQQAEENEVLLYSSECITEREVIEAQKLWGQGIIRIGKVYSDNGDYSKEAADFIQDMYGYDLSSVLFKPTLASEDQFRSSFDAALSYFVAGNEAYPEDKGFAIAPYTKVTFDNTGIINNSCRMAVAMGNYFFTPKGKDTPVKVEYTFAYVKDKSGKLRIVAHQSSLPYVPGS